MAWEPMRQTKNVGFHKNGVAVTWRTLSETHDLSKSESKKMLKDLSRDEIWLNNIYQVNVRKRTGPGSFDVFGEVFSGFPEANGEVAWLSIKRHDKETIHDWRDLQRIKNEVVGEEAEAIEIYPAESRLMDTANQYHLFVFQKQIPIGFLGRRVLEPEEAEQVGAKQRTLSN